MTTGPIVSEVDGIVAGSGIGLAAVRDVVEDYGGSLTVESTISRGRTVTLRLPLGSSSGVAAARRDELAVMMESSLP